MSIFENDLITASQEIASQITNFGEVLTLFDIPFGIKANAYVVGCPACKKGQSVFISKRLGIPRWKCLGCGAQRKVHDSYVGYFSLVLESRNEQMSRGHILEKIESFLLANKAKDKPPLPEFTLDFGKYQGQKLADCSPAYLKWLVEKCNECLPHEIQVAVCEHFDLPIPEPKFMVKF